MPVVEHSTIGNPRMVVSKMFKILIVGGDHTESMFLAELIEHTLRYGPANERFGTPAKLINEK